MENESGFVVDIASEDAETMADYTLIHSSGKGYCELYRTVREGKFIICKTLKAEYKNLRQFESLLRKEFEIGYSLDHPSICKTLSFENIPALGNSIVMEWVDGVTLSEYISRYKGKLPKDIARNIIIDLCSALEYLHSRQIVHRDLKPGNIMITHNGGRVKLIDFGLSDADSWKIHKEPAGTIPYMSPEQMRGDNTDTLCDIYSLGVIISEIGGRYYSKIAAHCCRRDRTDRFQSVIDVRKAILRRTGIIKRIVAITVVSVIAVAIAISYIRQTSADSSFDDITRVIIESQED